MTSTIKGIDSLEDKLCLYPHEYRALLAKLWIESEPEAPTSVLYQRSRTLDSDIRFSRTRPAVPAWAFLFTADFQKAIRFADRSHQGRILLALSELVEGPTTVRGDTVKALAGDLKGKWRYRIGDYRLVYEPIPSKSIIALLDFSARSGVYD